MPDVGFRGMKIYPWYAGSTNTMFVRMDCAVCGEGICQYTRTTLDELRAEYSEHITRVKHEVSTDA